MILNIIEELAALVAVAAFTAAVLWWAAFLGG